MADKSPNEVHSSGLLTKLGLYTAILIVISSMIGSGVFKKAAPMALDLESGGIMLLCWVIAGIVTLIGAATNAEIAGIIAAPGGQYVYFKEMYGSFYLRVVLLLGNSDGVHRFYRLCLCRIGERRNTITTSE